LIGNKWNYYFERYFELFRIRMKDKEITIQNLLKEITILRKDTATVRFEWKDIINLTDIYPIKSANPFLSLVGTDFNREEIIKLLMKGGELALYKSVLVKKLSNKKYYLNHRIQPLLRLTLTGVSDPLREDSFVMDIPDKDIKSLVFDGSINNCIVGFRSRYGEKYQFDNPIIIRNFKVESFPYQLRQSHYRDKIVAYSNSLIDFRNSKTIKGLLTHNGKYLMYRSPKV